MGLTGTKDWTKNQAQGPMAKESGLDQGSRREDQGQGPGMGMKEPGQDQRPRREDRGEGSSTVNIRWTSLGCRELTLILNSKYFYILE